MRFFKGLLKGILDGMYKGIIRDIWDLVSRVISTLIGVISAVTFLLALVTKSHDPLSSGAFDVRKDGVRVVAS